MSQECRDGYAQQVENLVFGKVFCLLPRKARSEIFAQQVGALFSEQVQNHDG